MKQLFTLLLILGLFAHAEAAEFTVNLNPNSGADFNNAQIAIDAAADGDIIYLQALPLSDVFDPADVSYGNILVDKQITIVGHGYFLGTAGLGDYDASFSPVPLNDVTFSANAQGAVLRSAIAAHVTVEADNVTLANNLFQTLTITSGGNTLVNSCYIESQIPSDIAVSLQSTISGHVFSNCFIGYNGNLSEGATILSSINTADTEFNHCNFANGNLHLGAHFVHNCIVYEAQITWIQGGSFNNNLFTVSPFVTPNNPLGEQQDESPITSDPSNVLVPAASLFDSTGPNDLQWRLSVNSPALNAGDDGDNSGMYTETNSYRPSGIADDAPIFIEINYLDVITSEIVLPIDFVVFSPAGNTISLIEWTVIPDDLFVGIQEYTTFTPSDLVHGFLSIDVDALPNSGVIAINAIDDAGLETGFQSIPFERDNTPDVVPNLQRFEFFYNVDPGIGNGNSIDIEQTTNFEGIVTFPTLITDGPTPGQNTLFVRVFDANTGVGTTYYHEFQFLSNGFTAECCDIDGDGFVGLADFLSFLQNFSLDGTGCQNGDFNQDGIVDSGDLLIFLSFFGTFV